MGKHQYKILRTCQYETFMFNYQLVEVAWPRYNNILGWNIRVLWLTMSPSIIILSTLSSDWSLLTQDWALIGPCRPLYQWAWSNEAAPLGTEGGGRESRRGVDMRGEIFTGEICGQAGQRIGDKAGRFWNTKIFQWMGWEASTTQATGPYLNYSIANQRYATDSFCSKRLVKFFSQWLLSLVLISQIWEL